MKLKSYSTVFFIFIAAFFSPLLNHAQTPHLDWAFGTGGSAGYDTGNAIAIDAQGNTYTTGYFGGTMDFDPGAGVHNLTSIGQLDMFILKTDAAGNFIWAQSYGGTGRVEGNAIAVSPAGNIYVTGMFSGKVDFDLSAGFDTITNADNPCNTEVFILKLDNAGNHIWTKSVAGVAPICTTETDEGFGLDLDQNESVYLTGSFGGHADFNPSTAPGDTFYFTTNGTFYEQDFFALKLDANGNFRWAKQIYYGIGYNLHVDPLGFVYVTGLYAGLTDFDPGPGTDMIQGFGSWDAFIMKFDTAGNYIWAKGLGGNYDDRGIAVTTDAAHNVYASGHFGGPIDLDPSASTMMLNNTSGWGIYFVKLDPSGNYIWAKSIFGPGGGERQGSALAVDATNHVYLAGHFTDMVDFNMSVAPADTFNLVAANGPFNSDAFILKTDTSGNFIWAIALGSTGEDRTRGIAVDGAANIYTTGFYAGNVDFDPEAGTHIITGNGTRDIYIQKLNQITVVVPENDFAKCNIVLFPNPFSETTSLLVQSPASGNYTFELFDVTGKVAEKQTGEFNRQMIIQKNNLSAGIYLYRILKNDEMVGTGKLIVE